MGKEDDPWGITYQKINNWSCISISRGLSAEIAFAKYLAFSMGATFVGSHSLAPVLTDNFIEEAINLVVGWVKKTSKISKED